ALMLLLGYMANKKNKSGDATEFFVVNRSLGILLCAGTYCASFLSAGTFVGTAGVIYSLGWVYVWQLIGSLAGPFFLCIVLVPKFWRYGYYNNALSMPDLFAERYSAKWSRIIFSLVILIVYIFGMSSMYLGLNAVWGQISDVPLIWIIIISAITILIFSCSGGARGVTWTDTACSAIMLVAVVIMSIVILVKSGGFESLAVQFASSPKVEGTSWMHGKDLIAPTNAYYTVIMTIAWNLTWFLGNTSQPHQVTRAYLAKNEKVARGAIALSEAVILIVVFAIPLVGAYARVLFPALGKADYAFPAVVMATLPSFVAAFVLVAIVAAIFSTASTMLIISGQCVSYDFYKKLINPEASDKDVLNISRIAMIVCSLLSIIIAYYAQTLPSLLFLWNSAFAMMGATITPSLVAAFYWKGATAKGNVASMITGMGVSIFLNLFPELKPFGLHPLLPALVGSILALIIVSKCTENPSPETLDKFFNPLVRYGETEAKNRGLL
ncbi:MAG TPA: sodium:solute symporter family protein, partial [Bacillota bacterium]|nr:sodium:solute symporter family protein [Bacillota bacterium]